MSFHLFQASDSYEEILSRKEVNLVVISTPPFAHMDFAKKALKWKKHVWIEKPIALTSGEAAEILSLDETGLITLVGHELRFLKSMRKMKQLIQEGYIGDIWNVRRCLCMKSSVSFRLVATFPLEEEHITR